MFFLAAVMAVLSGCSSPNKNSFRPHLYLGVTSNYSDSNATLEPKYFVPDHSQAGAGVWGAGWMVGRGQAIQVGNPAGNLQASGYVLLNDVSRYLSSKTSGVGFGAIVGLEMKVSKLRMSLEADCSTLSYGKSKQRDSLFEDFAFALSYRLGLKLGNYFTPYLLAGMEFNMLRGYSKNAHFQENTPINFWTLGVMRVISSESYFSNLDSGKVIQNPRLGCGFEINCFERFRFRFDCLWTLRRKFRYNFRTQTTLSVARNIAGALRTQVDAESPMTWYHKKFSTRFGVIMDL
jgi:opacity protein-like surface antigen